MPMGPAELADTVGLDICLAAGKSLAKGAATRRCRNSWPTRSRSDSSARRPARASTVGRREERSRAKPDAYDQRLIDSLIEPYLHEAEAAVKEGIVADAELADAGLIFGTGFAPFRGGPLHYLKNKK